MSLSLHKLYLNKIANCNAVISRDNLICDMQLKPFGVCGSYFIRMHYNLHMKNPKIVMEDPMVVVIREDGTEHPHLYEDESLCVYFPRYKEWTKNMPLSVVVPYINSWLYYYELWLSGEDWLGSQIPHKGKKKVI